MTSLPVRLLLLTATLLLAACVAAGRSRQAVEDQVSIRIENNLRPESEVTVRLISTSGTRRVLGSVSPHTTRTLEYAESPFSGSYRLTAQSADGREVSSQAFALFGGARVVWELFNNTLNVAAR